MATSIAKPPISVHVLDVTKGLPVTGVPVSLERREDDKWTFVNTSVTNSDGRCADLVEIGSGLLGSGRYRIRFDVDQYFLASKTTALYPYIDVVFDIKNSQQTYHLPLLLSPYGYSTYRGS